VQQRGVWHGTPANEELPFPIHHTRPQMDAIFSPVAASACSIIVQAMTCSPFLLSAPSFSRSVDTIVLFFLSEKSKEYQS
jgi:hypothetical protein